MTLTLKQALSAMHYREARPGKWCKPVGYHLLTFEEDRREWTNWFLGANNDGTGQPISRWSAAVLPADTDPLHFLKEQEGWSKYAKGFGGVELSQFQSAPLPEYWLETIS